MAVIRLRLERTRAGRKPQNVNLEVVKEMNDVWEGIQDADGNFTSEPEPDAGLSDGETYADRLTAQKVAQAYKSYMEKHFNRNLSAVTGKNPDGEGWVFSLNPDEVTETETPESADESATA